MNLKEMGDKELIGELIYKCRYYPESRKIKKMESALFSRLEDGARAIKAMEELNNLFPKCAPSPDRIPLCFVILDKYRSGKGGKKC